MSPGAWLAAGLEQAAAFKPVFLDCAVKSVAIMAMACLIARAMRRTSSGSRYLLWGLALTSLLVLPLMAVALPNWQLALLPAPEQTFDLAPVKRQAEAPSAEEGGVQAELGAAPAQDAGYDYIYYTAPGAAPELRPLPAAVASPGKFHSNGTPEAPARGTDWLALGPWGWLIAAWLAISFIAALRLVLGMLMLTRLQALSRREHAGPAVDTVNSIRAELGIRRPVALYFSQGARVPMTWGMLRASILLPESAHEWTAERMRIVLMHELIHVRRRDCLTQAVAGLACSLYWFNPLAWHAARQMRQECEQACDDQILAHGVKPLDYAEHLIAILRSTSQPALTSSMGIALGRYATFEARVKSILDSMRIRRLSPRMRLTIITAMGVLITTVATLKLTAQDAQDKLTVPAPGSFQWNVFLDGWKVIGPFATEGERDPAGSPIDFLGNEANPDIMRGVTYAGRAYQWIDTTDEQLDFNEVFQDDSNTSSGLNAYAYKEIESNADQDATLAVWADIYGKVWLNGEAVIPEMQMGEPNIDKYQAKVRLKKGRNVLVAKVQKLWGRWILVARFLPPGVEQPLLTLKPQLGPASDTLHLPRLGVDFLDEEGEVISRRWVSGHLKENFGAIFPLYEAEPAQAPASVRVHCQAAGYQPVVQVTDWKTARSAPIDVTINGDQTVRGRIVDAVTGRPIAGAVFAYLVEYLPARSDDEGKFELQNFSSTTHHLWVCAEGYRHRYVTLPFPVPERIELALQPGGKTLRGTVTDSQGNPIERALIVSGLRKGWQPNVFTDAEGRFSIPGLPEDRTTISPEIAHPDYIAKGTFNQRLDGALTEVSYKLERGTLVEGTVTDQDGRPLGAATVMEVGMGYGLAYPSTPTNADGSFKLGGLTNGEHRLMATFNGYAPAIQTVVVGSLGAGGVKFVLEPGRSVSGKVTDAAGNPLSDAWVFTNFWDGVNSYRRETHAAADGSYTLTDMPSHAVPAGIIKTGFNSKRDLIMTGGEPLDIVLDPNVKHQFKVRQQEDGAIPE